MTPIDDLPEPTRESWNVDAMWSRVRARTVAAATSGARRKSSVAPYRRRIATYAAATLLLVAGGGALVSRSSNIPAAAVPVLTLGQYSTSRAQYAIIRLADGSEVTLAPESHLTVSARFARGMREISLDGEAIFSVHHDAAHPFRVHTRSALIEDIGTRFDLRAYSGDNTITVAVVEGSVSMTAVRRDSAVASAIPDRPTVLERGDVGIVDGRGETSTERPAQVSSYIDWASGRLSFIDRPLEEVLRTIARWYDLDVRVTDDRLRSRRVTADFARGSSTEMIDALALTMDAVVERDGRGITLRSR